ncbi:hypothetical protein SOVF_067800 [Spinacia oleracea]|nr:hypothetical protein SOVF_067800 [Spinacia oleracea]
MLHDTKINFLAKRCVFSVMTCISFGIGLTKQMVSAED